jgi:hypothetical protein
MASIQRKQNFFFFFNKEDKGKLNLKNKILLNYNLNIARAIPAEDIEKYLNDYKVKNSI